METYQHHFIDFILENKALLFGEFKLKSGRISPYFFNSGVFKTGETLSKLGSFYAAAINHANISFDVLFGPAYKGIPLACSTAIAFHNEYHRNTPYCFNRKEIKDHGEGGNIIGTPLSGRILIIDDVITAGTAIRESMELIKSAQAQLAGVVIALDRQERGTTTISAIAEIEKTYQTKVISIIRLEDIIEYLSHKSNNATLLSKLKEYRHAYHAVT